MSETCRTCSQAATGQCFLLDGSVAGSSDVKVRDIVADVLPEVDLELMPQPVLCKNCLATLFLVHQFRTEVAQNETRLKQRYEVEYIEADEVLEENESEALADQLPEKKSTKDFIEIKNRKVAKEEARPFQCSVCDYASKSKAILMNHLNTHTGEKPFSCPHCDYKASRKAHLDNHLKIHTGEKPFECAYCLKTFSTKQYLKNHLLVHTREARYRCTQCDFRAVHRPTITNHIRRVHFGESVYSRPVMCDICGRKLSGQGTLRSHMRIHRGVKPFLCEQCGRYFRDRSMLKNHLMVHSGEKPYGCAECDYTASRKAHIEEHMKTHRDDVTLQECNVCRNRYTSRWLLNKHVKEAHAVGENADEDT